MLTCTKRIAQQTEDETFGPTNFHDIHKYRVIQI